METFTPYLLDGLVVLVVFLFLYKGAKRGFAATTVSLIGFVASFAVAIVLGKLISTFIYEILLKQQLIDLLTKNILNVSDPQALVDSLTQAINTLPKSLVNMMEFETGGIAYAIGATLTENSQAIAETVVNLIVGPVIRIALYGISFVILLIVCNIFVKIVARALRLVGKIPLIGPLNQLFGTILGALQGILFMYVVASVLAMMVSASNNTLPFLSAESILDTFLFQKFLTLPKLVGTIAF